MSEAHKTEATVEATVEATQVAKARPAIRNIASLSDAALRTALVKLGVEVPEEATRNDMIRMAKEGGFHDYSGNIVPAKFKAIYRQNGGNNGDTLAVAMKDAEFQDLRKAAEANGIDIHRWDHCNAGQVRMNLSNVLRGMIRRGEYVVVGQYEWEKGELVGQPETEEPAQQPEAQIEGTADEEQA